MNPLLKALVDGTPGQGMNGDSPLAPAPRSPIKKLNYTHQALVDLIVTHPEMDQNDYADHFGMSASWISTVICSDIFQARLAERREEMVDPEVRTSLKLRFEGILSRSVEILGHKLARRPEEIPDQLAVQVAKMASQSLGYGVRETKISVSETHNHLEILGENLVGLLRRRKAAIAGEIINGEAQAQAEGRALESSGSTSGPSPQLPEQPA